MSAEKCARGLPIMVTVCHAGLWSSRGRTAREGRGCVHRRSQRDEEALKNCTKEAPPGASLFWRGTVVKRTEPRSCCRPLLTPLSFGSSDVRRTLSGTLSRCTAFTELCSWLVDCSRESWFAVSKRRGTRTSDTPTTQAAVV